MNTILKILNIVTKVARNVVWWYLTIGAFGAVIAYYIPTPDTVTRILCGVISILIPILILGGISLWRSKNRWKRISSSFQHIHQLNHNIRENIGKRCQPTWDERWVPTATVAEQHLKLTVQKILDDGANCLTALTGDRIISCLVIPVGTRKMTHNLLFKTIVYGGNPTDERRRGSKIHEKDLINQAFSVAEPIILSDFKKDYKQGNFVPGRLDWQKYYMSSLMARFHVGDKPDEEKIWGVLSFDCIKKNTFKEDWKHIACVFSDALGLVLSLQNPYHDEWSVTDELEEP